MPAIAGTTPRRPQASLRGSLRSLATPPPPPAFAAGEFAGGVPCLQLQAPFPVPPIGGTIPCRRSAAPYQAAAGNRQGAESQGRPSASPKTGPPCRGAAGWRRRNAAGRSAGGRQGRSLASLAASRRGCRYARPPKRAKCAREECAREECVSVRALAGRCRNVQVQACRTGHVAPCGSYDRCVPAAGIPAAGHFPAHGTPAPARPPTTLIPRRRRRVDELDEVVR